MKIRPQFLLVPPWLLITPLACYFIFPGIIQFYRFRFQLSGPISELDEIDLRMKWLALVTACVLYGIYRVAAYHPVFDQSYRVWLATTPWTSNIPLPMGPITLAWQDAMFLCPAALLAALHAKLNPAFVLIAFGVGYVVCAGYALVLTRRDAVYWLALGLAGVVREIKSPHIALAIMAVLCIIAHVSLHRSLAKFPWESLALESNKDCVPSPFDRLSPKPPRLRISPVQGALVGILLGAWTYAISWQAGAPEDPVSVRLGFIFALAVVCLIRSFIYMSAGFNSVTLIGRLATGRLIMPRYDKIFVAPVFSALLAVVVPDLLIRFGLPAPWWQGITAALVVTVLLSMRPALGEWKLTGAHRIPTIRGAEYMRV